MRRLLVSTIVGFAALVTAANARADDVYTVATCSATGPGSGWSINNAGAYTNACPRPGITASAPKSDTGPLGAFQLIFTPPPSTHVAGYRLWRIVRLQLPWNYSLFNSPGVREQDRVETCWAIAQCGALGDGHTGNPPDVAQGGLDSTGIILHVDCNDGSNQGNHCPGGNPSNVAVSRFDVDLRDLSDPVIVGTPSGDLLDPAQPVAGVRTVSFSATDQGSGVYGARIEVDGQTVASDIVDGNNGKCAKPFTAVVPCRTNASGSLSVNTAALPDGVHSMRLVVTDATETNSASYGPVQVRTANQAAVCDPALTVKTTPVTARWKGTKSSAVTRRSGRGTVVGKVAHTSGGLQVDLLARERRSGAVSTILASTTTAPNGSFTLAVPPGPSRRVRAAIHRQPTDPVFACSRGLNLRVPARATLHASPRSLAPGGRVRLSGRLEGGRIPSRGKLIDLQAREQGNWHTFASVRTKRSGRFSTHYRFHRSAPHKTYPMRVRVRPESSYPYALGYSRAVRVRVR
jgi:hypothetical protein